MLKLLKLLKSREVRWAMAYISVAVTANYTALWFVPLPFGMIALGTALFGITFTARDYVHRLGRPKVYTMIFVAAFFSAVLVWLGQTPWRIIIASVSAIILAEATDTEIYQAFINRTWIVRVMASNAVSIPLDTILFNTIAFLGVFSIPLMVSIVTGEVIVKYIIGLIVAFVRFEKGKLQVFSKSKPVLE